MSKEINIIGYSGHAYVCIEIALLNNITVGGYCDLNKKNENPYELNFLGEEQNMDSDQEVFICIADNTIRKNIFKNLPNLDFNINLIHPKSIISNTVNIGFQTLICAGAIINSQVKIGNGCIINTGSIIEHECIIRDFTHIAPGAVLCGNVQIGKGSFIGANSVIKQGVKIGCNVNVGAGAVVINDILDNKTVVGNPSRNL
jgi:sugar O-acyltransferase (sialic acid O-acetyltransferase NeuD family)